MKKQPTIPQSHGTTSKHVFGSSSLSQQTDSESTTYRLDISSEHGKGWVFQSVPRPLNLT